MSELSEYFGPNLGFQEREDLNISINALILAAALSGFERETLCKAMAGPMSSGDTPCKASRGSLLSKGILCQTASLADNYTFSVAYPLGWKVWKALGVIESFTPQQGKGEEWAI